MFVGTTLLSECLVVSNAVFRVYTDDLRVILILLGKKTGKDDTQSTKDSEAKKKARISKLEEVWQSFML